MGVSPLVANRRFADKGVLNLEIGNEGKSSLLRFLRLFAAKS